MQVDPKGINPLNDRADGLVSDHLKALDKARQEHGLPAIAETARTAHARTQAQLTQLEQTLTSSVNRQIEIGLMKPEAQTTLSSNQRTRAARMEQIGKAFGIK